ncbi:hypothetical protein ACA086_14340 [Muriicola sp. E247]|uniref:hypothetical protein n=1 Tax=Muriicola sp. E247 TaxID=3242730 RepID=UPI00352319BA
MKTQNIILWGLSLTLVSCMEDVTTIYEQPLPEVLVADIPEEEHSPSATTASPEKVSEWLGHMQGTNGLVESAEFTDFVSLYDNALAALAFTADGNLSGAEQILDYFDNRLQSEFNANNGGFFQYRDTSGEQSSRIWMGDNAWLLLAVNHYHEKTQSNKYENLARELETWLRSLQEEDGGLKGGINEDGSLIPKVTEGIITAFNAVKGFDDFHRKILLFLQQQRWDVNEKVLITDTENPAYNHALDLYTLGYMILEDFPEEVLNKAHRFYNSQNSTTHEKLISGYCFDDDKDVVWLEGTAQMAMAFNEANQEGNAQNTILNLEEAFISSTSNVSTAGLPYTANFGTNFGANQLWEHTDITPTISSSAWYLFVKNDFNPFQLEKEKNIPEELKFWTDSGVN